MASHQTDNTEVIIGKDSVLSIVGRSWINQPWTADWDSLDEIVPVYGPGGIVIDYQT